MFTRAPIVERSIVMNVSVCLCLCVFVCPRSYLRTIHVRSSRNFFVRVTYGRGSVLLWRRSDTLRTSGFTDDQPCRYDHKPCRYDCGHICKAAGRRRSAEAQLTRSLGLGYKRRVGIPVAGTGLLLAVGLGGSTGGGVCRL